MQENQIITDGLGRGMEYEGIRDLRKTYKISQIKLAEISGFTPAKISAWELHKNVPSQEELSILEGALRGAIARLERGDRSLLRKRIRSNSASGKKSPATIESVEDYRGKVVRPSGNPYAMELEHLFGRPGSISGGPKAIALFSGCGGFTLGFDAAGFDVVGHVEIEDSANRIYEANFPNSPLLAKDVNDVSDAMMEGWKKRLGAIDVIIGGPPCQGFSLAGKRDPKDARSQLYRQYVRIVSKMKPRVVVMENVRLLTSMKDAEGRLFIDMIIKEFTDVGYSVSLHDVNALEYGVPQTRERIILIGLRRDDGRVPQYVFPSPEYSLIQRTNSTSARAKLARTFRDATNDLARIESGETSDDPLHWAVAHPRHVIDWLKDVPEGHSAHENKDPSKRPPSGFNTSYKRIRWDEPCSTIATNFGMISGCRNVHPESTRSLSVREAARVQSFPDSFAFVGTWGNVRRAIGNAVPPLLAYKVAESIRDQLFTEDA